MGGRAEANHAPSNRARCRECKDQIHKGSLRVGLERNSMMVWYHPECFRPPQWLTGISDVDLGSGVTTKEKADLRHVIESHQTTHRARSESPTKTKKGTEEEEKAAAAAAASTTKKHHGDDHGHGHGHDHSKRVCSGGTGGDGVLADCKAKLQEKYDAMHVDQLKAILHCNDQIVTGVKSELVDRCVDGEMHGAMQRCPRCKIGHIHVHHLPDGETRYSCAGHFDTSIGYFVSCPFKASDIHRSRWVLPGEPKIKDEDSAESKSKSKSYDLPLPAFSPAIENMEAKGAATAVLGLCRLMGLSLPKNDSLARVAIGSILMRHKRVAADDSGEPGSFDVKAALRAAMAKYPPLSPAAASAASLPKTPNGDLADLFEELAAYEGHIGERWKMMAYQHAATAINSLTYKLDKHKHCNGYFLKDEHHIENLGKGSVHKIEEYLETGKIQELEDFRTKADSDTCF